MLYKNIFICHEPHFIMTYEDHIDDIPLVHK
jgi:hypothetical protein